MLKQIDDKAFKYIPDGKEDEISLVFNDEGLWLDFYALIPIGFLRKVVAEADQAGNKPKLRTRREKYKIIHGMPGECEEMLNELRGEWKIEWIDRKDYLLIIILKSK